MFKLSNIFHFPINLKDFIAKDEIKKSIKNQSTQKYVVFL